MRKFTNKLWNMARFIEMKRIDTNLSSGVHHDLGQLEAVVKHSNDKAMLEKMAELAAKVTKQLEHV